MENLVFVAPNHLKSIPFTTSDVIAKYAQVKHHSIQQIISKHLKDLEEFGQVAFEMRAVKYSRGTNQLKIYHLNEEQATLLITYLKNTGSDKARGQEKCYWVYPLGGTQADDVPK